MLQRSNNRGSDEPRLIKFTRGFTKNAAGSVLTEFGETKVLVTACVEHRVPKFLSDSGSGWIHAEYAMLPGATVTRNQRDRDKASGRNMEIQRLIGRSLRAALNLKLIPDLTVIIDADVIQADGGTRTASISGAYVALHDAMQHLKKAGSLKEIPSLIQVAAISVGIVDGEPMLDLDYQEDSAAIVDANVIMTAQGRLVEFQATGEEATFSKLELDTLYELAKKGIQEVMVKQNKALLESI